MSKGEDMKKWLSQWLISLMAMGLYAMPAVAIDGTVNGIEIGPVTCLNYITDQAAVGRVTAGIYDCSELAATNGDAIGVVLNGIATDGSELQGCTMPMPIQEQEPNDDASSAQVLPDPCVSISGAASSGEDLDAYHFDLSAPQVLRIGITPNGTPFIVAIFDSSDPANIQPLGVCGRLT
jgi:hypothetical protein